MKFDRQRLVFGLYLLVLIGIAELVIGHFKLPAWPAFMAMIFFFLGEMNVKKVPNILVGGVAGIAGILLAKPIITLLAPMIGVELATLTFVLVIVYAIVAFGEMVPVVFNNYMFMYLTVSGIAVQTANPNPLLWMLMTVVGGGLLVAGVIGILKLMAASAGAGAPVTHHGA